MRIGVDMLAAQAPDTRHRGIGRYARNLLAALLEADPEHEYLLYMHEGLPAGPLPEAPNATARVLAPDPARGEAALADAIDRIARHNPDGLDALLILSPMEVCRGYAPPARPVGGPRMFAVVYDLIPFLFPGRYLVDPAHSARLHEHLRRVRGYDALLAISEATRGDCLRVLGLPAARVVAVGTASDGRYFTPDRSPPAPAEREELRRIGIDRPFVFCLGGGDPRKNHRGLVEAFARLPGPLRRGHRLVVTCALSEAHAAAERRHAAECGVGESLVLTGELADEQLRTLYRRCAAFAFPSLYEGFGLPLLEAMHCGAAVVAGNNSAQPEVVGDAGLLVAADDPGEIAAALGRLLEDRALAGELGRRAEGRASGFSWAATARRARDVLHRPAAPPERARAAAGAGARPRIAVFAAPPPPGSREAETAALLIEALGREYAIDLYYDPRFVPHLALDPAFSCHDYRLFARREAALGGYCAAVYLPGDSPRHRFIGEALARRPDAVPLSEIAAEAPGRLRPLLDGARRVLTPTGRCLAWAPGLRRQAVATSPGAGPFGARGRVHLSANPSPVK